MASTIAAAAVDDTSSDASPTPAHNTKVCGTCMSACPGIATWNSCVCFQGYTMCVNCIFRYFSTNHRICCPICRKHDVPGKPTEPFMIVVSRFNDTTSAWEPDTARPLVPVAVYSRSLPQVRAIHAFERDQLHARQHGETAALRAEQRRQREEAAGDTTASPTSTAASASPAPHSTTRQRRRRAAAVRAAEAIAAILQGGGATTPPQHTTATAAVEDEEDEEDEGHSVGRSSDDEDGDSAADDTATQSDLDFIASEEEDLDFIASEEEEEEDQDDHFTTTTTDDESVALPSGDTATMPAAIFNRLVLLSRRNMNTLRFLLANQGEQQL